MKTSLMNQIIQDMKTISKYMRLFLIIIGMSICGATWANVAVFDASVDVGATAATMQINKGAFTVRVGGGSMGGNPYQANANQNIIVSGEVTITRIEITCQTSDMANNISNPTLNAGTTSSLTTSGTKRVWVGSGSRTISFPHTSKVKFTRVEITYSSIPSGYCELKLWNSNTSAYEVWALWSQSEYLPYDDAPEVSGYVWGTGWSTYDIPTPVGYPDNSKVIWGRSATAGYYTTLYAMYINGSGYTTRPTSVPMVTITFKPNTGSGSEYTQRVAENVATDLESNKFTKTGYSFEGWAEAADEVAVYEDGDEITIDEDIDLYAKWTINNYTVTMAKSPSAGGSATIDGGASKTANYNTSWGILATPNSGYYFKNWSVSPSYGTVTSSTTASTNYTIGASNVTVTANFGQYVHLLYDANNGSGAPTDATDYKDGDKATVSATVPTRSGYVFLGWANNNTATVAAYTDGSKITMGTTDKTIYAVWCKDISGNSFSTATAATTPTYNYGTGYGSNTISWGAVTDATSYSLTITNTTDDEVVYGPTTVSASSNYTFNSMVVGKSYTATVTASSCTSEKSSSVSDLTVACPALAGTVSVSIPNGTVTKTSAIVNLSLTNAFQFDVWLQEDGESDKIGRETISANGSGEASKTFTGLTNDTRYYVHVIAHNRCDNVTAEKSTDYFNTKHEEVYHDYKVACVTLSVASEDDPTPVYITSRNGMEVLAAKKLQISTGGAIAGHRIALSGDNLKFYKLADGKYKDISSDYLTATGDDTEQDVYVSYTPSTTGTGAIETRDLTIACDGWERTFSGVVEVRNLPDAIAIVAKVGNTWHALPADLTGASTPASEMVSTITEDGVLKAVGPNTIQYRLWPVATTNGTRDRFGNAISYTPSALYGDRLRFSATNNTTANAGLWANNSGSANTINNDGVIDAVDKYFAADAAYEWKVTTQKVGGEFVYTLQTDQSNNTNKLRLYGHKWGTYGESSGTADLYILPLTVKAKADISILEWGVDEVAVSYANGSSASAINARIGTGDPSDVTKDGLGGDVYKLTGVGDLQGNPAKQLVLTATEGGTPKQAVFQIPLIVTTSKSEAELRTAAGGDAIAKGTDVVIRSGGILTTGTASGNFADLYIYPGGKANISNDLAVTNVYLRGGFSWLGGEYDHPQMLVADRATDANKRLSGVGTAGHGIYYELYAKKDMYYMMALPKDVNLNDVTNGDGVKNFKAWIKKYNGGYRTGDYGSKAWLNASSVQRGVGYEISIDQDVPHAGRPYGVLRFPLLQSTGWSNETTDCAVDVIAWGWDKWANGELSANNVGWNFIGNPYFSAFNNGSSYDSKIVQQGFQKHGNPWDGTWDWIEDDATRYFTIPHTTWDEYYDVRADNYKLDAFYPFFVQVNVGTQETPGTLTFGGTRDLKMPSLIRQAVRQREIVVDFMLLDSNGKADVAGLNISNDYSELFDADDKEKTIKNNDYMKVYTLVDGIRTAFNSLPEEAAELPIPVGVIIPEAGDYTFSFASETSELEHLWLIDYAMSAETDLLMDDYTFSGTVGQYNERFAINAVIKKEGETTDLGSVIDKSKDKPLKFIYQDKMYILLNGVIYDITGRKVREINK